VDAERNLQRHHHAHANPDLTGFDPFTREEIVERINEVWTLSALKPYIPKESRANGHVKKK
jgi:hypothetical protein